MYVRNIFSFTTATVIYVKLLPDGEKISSMEESMLYAGSFPCLYPIQVILTQPTETQPLGFCEKGSCGVDSPYSFSFGSTIIAQQKEVIVLIHRWESEIVTKETGLV